MFSIFLTTQQQNAYSIMRPSTRVYCLNLIKVIFLLWCIITHYEHVYAQKDIAQHRYMKLFMKVIISSNVSQQKKFHISLTLICVEPDETKQLNKCNDYDYYFIYCFFVISNFLLIPKPIQGERLTGPKMISPKNHSSLIAKSETITN